MDIPTHIFPEIVPPGTVLGELLPSVIEDINVTGLSGLPVIAPACHDTGCAVAAVPATGSDLATPVPARGRWWGPNCQSLSSTRKDWPLI